MPSNDLVDFFCFVLFLLTVLSWLLFLTIIFNSREQLFYLAI